MKYRRQTVQKLVRNPSERFTFDNAIKTVQKLSLLVSSVKVGEWVVRRDQFLLHFDPILSELPLMTAKN